MILIFSLFLLFLFLGVQVVFALALPGLIYAIINISDLRLSFMVQEMTSPFFSFTLLALPAFLLSGRLMNIGGVTKRILNFALALVGRFKGGIAYSNALSSMIFASMSGTAIGDAGGLGRVQIDMMTKSGFKKDFSGGLTAASSVL